MREAKSVRQIERDVQNQLLPPPDEILNGRWYWWLSTLEKHDRERPQSTTRAPKGAKPRKDVTARPQPGS